MEGYSFSDGVEKIGGFLIETLLNFQRTKGRSVDMAVSDFTRSENLAEVAPKVSFSFC